MTQSYMGALKSWWLVPSTAAFGASAIALRASTLAWALMGLLFSLRFARQLGGLPLACATALLLAIDPSLLFAARHDWGSFSAGFALRAAALDLALAAWRQASRLRALGAGLALGLALYNKIDAAVFAAGALTAALLAGLAATRARGTSAPAAGGPGRLLPALAGGALLGAAPLLAALPGALVAARTLAETAALRAGDWPEKAQVLLATFDGSYFERLMRAGGSFEHMFEGAGFAPSPLPALLLAAPALLGWHACTRRDALAPAHAFLALAALLVQAGLFAMPRAVRLHHVLGSYPLPPLALAAALALPFRGPARSPGLGRALALLTSAAIAASQLVRLDATFDALRESGGKGRWSSALQHYADELAAAPGSEAVAFDWGLDLPLRYAHRGISTRAPFWQLWTGPIPAGGWRFDGDAHQVYLVYGGAYAVFPYGVALLSAVQALPAGAVEIRSHADAQGETAFFSLRFPGPHQLIYREESRRFEVRLR